MATWQLWSFLSIPSNANTRVRVNHIADIVTPITPSVCKHLNLQLYILPQEQAVPILTIPQYVFTAAVSGGGLCKAPGYIYLKLLVVHP